MSNMISHLFVTSASCLNVCTGRIRYKLYCGTYGSQILTVAEDNADLLSTTKTNP